METRANYLLVGSFVLLLIVGLVGFVIWLAKFQFEADFARYDIYFDGRVSGLSVGSGVSLRGVPVGEVLAIGLDPDNVERVLVTIEVTAATPIREDTIASLEQQAITGSATILLTGGSQAAAALTAQADRQRPVIRSERSGFEQVLEGAPELVASLNVLIARANSVLNTDNQRAIATTLDALSQFSSAIAERTDDLQLLLSDSAGAVAGVRDASVAFEALAEQLTVDSATLSNSAQATLQSIEGAAGAVEATLNGGDGDEVVNVLTSVRTSAEAIAAMATEIQLFVGENREPINEFTNSTLFEISGFLNEARALLDGIGRVTTQVERDPARFLFGNQQQGYETAE